ncbi:MAG: hypothetical protein CMF70_06690, partial [Magnetovibrio sp.]|nr:hypothetical protein [Magnetovibrio sp.]
IPDSVETIKPRAFEKCRALTNVTIGNSVKTIQYLAFSLCNNLKSVTIGNSVQTIENAAFKSCGALTSVTIPDSVEYIGDDAFKYCVSLTNVTIGNSVKEIKAWAFAYTSLTSVTIPDSVEYIGAHAFGMSYSGSVREFDRRPVHHWPLQGDGNDRNFRNAKVHITLQGDAYPLVGGGVVLPNNASPFGFLDLGDSFSFAATNGFTFAVWVKIESYSRPHGMILNLRDHMDSNAIDLKYYSTSRRASVEIRNDGGTRMEFTTPDCNPSNPENDPCYFFPVADPARWVHVAIAVTTDGTWTLFRDGATQDDWKATNFIAANPDSVAYTNAALGRYEANIAWYYLDGSFRDALLYDRALSADELVTVAAEGLSTWASFAPTASPSAPTASPSASPSASPTVNPERCLEEGRKEDGTWKASETCAHYARGVLTPC